MAVCRGFVVLLFVACLCDVTVGRTDLSHVGASHMFPQSSDQYESYHESFKSCRVGELYCSNKCDLLVLCLANHESLTVRNCTETAQLCDTTTSQCLDPGSATCEPAPEPLNLTCHATGLLPNPLDCHTFFTCPVTGSPGTRHSCSDTDPAEYGYDPLRNTCTYTAEDRVCVENPVPECVVPSQSGGQIENPNIYYICVHDPDLEGALVPWLFRCNRASEVFDDLLRECVVRLPTTTTTTSLVTTRAPGGGGTNQPTHFWLLLLLAVVPYLPLLYQTIVN